MIPDFTIDFWFEFSNVAENQSEIRAEEQFCYVAKVDQSKTGKEAEF
jgi:hypothetical protein